MALAKAFFSFDNKSAKIHTAGQFSAKYNHNYRIEVPVNADIKRLTQNEELISLDPQKEFIFEGRENYKATEEQKEILKSGSPFNNKFKERIHQMDYYVEHKVAKNAVKGFEFTLQIGTGDLPTDFSLEEWKKKSVEWIKATFGDNCVSAVLHMDETNPHIHCMVIPEVEGKLNCREMFNRKHILEYQESYAEVAKSCGLGTRTKGSRARHDDIALFYEAVNDAVIEHLPEPMPEEDIEEYYERANKILHKKNLQMLHAKKEMEKAFDDIKNNFVGTNLEKIELLQELQNLYETLGHNLDEAKKKIKMAELLNIGIKCHPDKELVARATKDTSQLIQFATEYIRNHPELSQEHLEA